MNCAHVDAPISAAKSGNGSPSSRLRQRALAEGPVDDHRHAAFRRQRQEPVFGLAVEDVIAELHEVELVPSHDLLEEIVPATFRCGDADIAYSALRLHGEQGLQMLLPGDEVVDLQEVEALHAPERARSLDLRWTAFAEEVHTFSAENSALGRPNFSRP